MLLGEIKKSPSLFHKNDGITEEFKKEELEEKKKKVDELGLILEI